MQEEYADTLAVIERSILATDLALHFKDAPALSAMAAEVHRSPDPLSQRLNAHAKHLLQAAMMTTADLGAATKPWEVHRYVSQLIADEFWTQGDLERRELNIQPQPMFDRSVALEVSQMEFLDNLCLPLYEDMAKFSLALKPLLDGCLANRRQWAADAREKSNGSQKSHESEQGRNL